MTHKLKALLILVERLSGYKEDTILESGIIIPSMVKHQENIPLKGIVKQVGSGLKKIPIEVKEGDTILYGIQSVITEVEKMDLINQKDIILIL